ncbi:MAG: glycosyltransferase [Bacteroidota bacterium]
MTLSVAMCTFNGERFLREQLLSIFDQSRLPDEIVVVDDGSTDQTMAILKTLTADSKIKMRLFTNRERLGVVQNFERAIQYCKGDVIVLSDQDDRWHPRKIEKIQAAFSEKSDLQLLFSDVSFIDADSKPMASTLWEQKGFDRRERKEWQQNPARKQYSFFQRDFVSGNALAIHRDFAKFARPFPKDRSLVLHDGWMLFLAALTQPEKMAFISEPLTAYRLYDEQLVGVHLQKSLKRRMRMWKPVNRWREAKQQLRRLVYLQEELRQKKVVYYDPRALDMAIEWWKVRIQLLDTSKLSEPVRVRNFMQNYKKFTKYPVGERLGDLVASLLRPFQPIE